MRVAHDKNHRGGYTCDELEETGEPENIVPPPVFWEKKDTCREENTDGEEDAPASVENTSELPGRGHGFRFHVCHTEEYVPVAEVDWTVTTSKAWGLSDEPFVLE